MSEIQRALSRTPSQGGVRAVFSRPPSETGDEAPFTGRISTTCEPLDKNASQAKTGVLITELGYESDEEGDSEEEEQADEQVEAEKADDADVQEDKKSNTKPVQPEVAAPDIFNEQEWDTDLEDGEETIDDGPPFRGLYKSICDKHGCSPNSYFMRHIEEKEIHLKYHGFTKHESCALAKVLRSIICVDTLDLEDNWLRNVGCKQLCKMLLENDNIHEMNLSQNQLGIEAAIHLAHMLKTNHTLQALSLSANGFEDNVAEVLAEALEDCRLRSLRLCKNQFGDKTGNILGNVLATNDYIETLDISWNMIRGAGGWVLAKGLKENIRLRVLDLSWNGLGEKGGIAIAEALLLNSTLTELNISANRLNNNVAMKFAKVITANEALQVLQINDNPISTSGAISLVTALLNTPNSTIEHLGLEGNPVEYEFVRTLRELQGERKVTVTHGSILRSGNTSQDLGKPAIGPAGPTKPVLIMEENLIINNTKRLQELFRKYYESAADRGMCDPEELIECLKIMSPGLNIKQLTTVVHNIPKNHHNLIPLRQKSTKLRSAELNAEVDHITDTLLYIRPDEELPLAMFTLLNMKAYSALYYL